MVFYFVVPYPWIWEEHPLGKLSFFFFLTKFLIHFLLKFCCGARPHTLLIYTLDAAF